MAALLLSVLLGMAAWTAEARPHPLAGLRRLHGEGDGWNYAENGKDWGKVAEICTEGLEQSPIHISTSSVEPIPTSELSTRFGDGALGTISGVSVVNTGSGLKVEWEDWAEAPTAMVAVAGESLNTFPYTAEQEFTTVPITPLQFHFHSPSEHLVDGVFYPLEGHIVNIISGEDLPACGEAGCLSVIGVMYALSEEDNPELEPLIADLNMTLDGRKSMPEDFTFSLNSMLPEDPTYITYAGSLTTPPCSEGVRWHLLLEPRPISIRQLETIQLAMAMATQHGDATIETTAELASEGSRTNNRLPQPLGDRIVYINQPSETDIDATRG